MNKKPQMLDVVALVEDLPSEKLVKGQVGTVVHMHDEDHYEVEFSDDEGRSYALLPLHRTALLILHHAPVPT